MTEIFSTRWLTGLGKFFPTTVAVQAATLTRDAFGEPIASWATVSGWSALKGHLAPATEHKLFTLSLPVEETTHVLELQGYYPTITPAHKVLIGSTRYEITGVRSDSQGVHTYLGLRLVV